MKKNEGYKHLTLEEYQSIFVMRELKESYREIAKRAGRSVSVIYGVLNNAKHSNWKTWCHMSPLERAEFVFRKRSRDKSAPRGLKLERDEDLLKFVLENLIEKNLSPEQISSQVPLVFEGKKLSFKSIYAYVRRNCLKLQKYLFEKGKRRRVRVSHRRGRFKEAAPDKRSISQGPESANNRTEFGHWEGDTILSKRYGSGAILSLRERVTRRQVFILVPDLTACTIAKNLKTFFEKLPSSMRKSITFDRGSEFAPSELYKLEEIFEELQIYFCDAYKPYQKGSVENGHRGFRWHFPKGTSFADHSQDEIYRVEALLNNKPMKLHQFRSPSQIWQDCIAKAA